MLYFYIFMIKRKREREKIKKKEKKKERERLLIKKQSIKIQAAINNTVASFVSCAKECLPSFQEVDICGEAIFET